jgi:hypothetical protein
MIFKIINKLVFVREFLAFFITLMQPGVNTNFLSLTYLIRIYDGEGYHAIQRGYGYPPGNYDIPSA